MSDDIAPPHGGYERLISYQKSRIVYDATVHFCNRFLKGDARTSDQMIQAARPGKQNIVEGSLASGNSKQTELFLTGVAWASLGELFEDYEDFCRNRGIERWAETHPYGRRLRALNRIPNADYETFRKGIESDDPAIAANVIMGLIQVTRFLLDRQRKRLRDDFVQEGGLRERMTRARRRERDRQRRTEEGKEGKDSKDPKDIKDIKDR